MAREECSTDEIKIKEKVRRYYAQLAKKKDSCCSISCCQEPIDREKGCEELEYKQEESKSLPQGVFSLGCGNPVALALLKEGETVLDLGSGSGFDCFLASKKVGERGKVIGVDMTPEMITMARELAVKNNCRNVEFRLGEIENLPAADNSVDVVISNCVINLSSNKKRVFEETFRVLRVGGRLIISDIVLLKQLPMEIKESEHAYVACVSGALMKNEYLKLIKEACFQEVKVIEEKKYDVSLEKAKKYAGSIASITVYGIKPNKQ